MGIVSVTRLGAPTAMLLLAGLTIPLAAIRAPEGAQAKAEANAQPATQPATQPAEVTAARIGELIVQLGSEKSPDREQAQQALVEIGMPAVPARRGVYRPGEDPTPR